MWIFHSLAGWPGALIAIVVSTALTVVFRDRMRTPSAVWKLDGVAIILSFAAFLIATFMVAEAIALWTLHSFAGWPGAIIAIAVSIFLKLS